MRMLLPMLLMTACKDPGGPAGPIPQYVDGDPIEVLDTYSGPSFAELLEVRLWGDRIAFCSGVQGVNVYDATDPSDLEFLDRAAFEFSSGSYPRCQHLAIDDESDLIYVSAHADRMAPIPWIEVFDASDPTRLISRWASTFPENLEGMEVHGDLLVVAAHADGILVLARNADGSLSHRSRMTEGLDNPWSVRSGPGDLVYVANGPSGIAVVDLSDPTAPTVVSTLDLPGTTKDIDIDGDRLFAALGSAGVALVSLEDPESPQLIETEETPGSALAVGFGDTAEALFVSDWNDLRVFDLVERNDLVLAGREPLTYGSAATTRSLGLEARGDVMFSSNWTEMVSYRYHPDLRAPDLFVTPDRLGLPDTEPGDMTWDVVSVQNHGTVDLVFEDFDADNGLNVVDLPDVLAPGETTSARIEWTPGSTAAFRGEIRFETNDPDQPDLPMGVFGNGAGLTVGDTVPEFTFQTIDGGTLALADHEGPVLLAYFATF